jgi:hypothetical protein
LLWLALGGLPTGQTGIRAIFWRGAPLFLADLLGLFHDVEFPAPTIDAPPIGRS